jgi:hypothetical protein
MLEGKYDEALSWSSEAVKDGETSLELILTHMESLYHLHRFNELRRVSTRYLTLAENNQHISPETVETLKLWAKPA